MFFLISSEGFSVQKFGVLLFCVVIVFWFVSIDYCCVCLIYLMCLLKLYKEKKKKKYIYIYIHAHTSMIGLIYYINCLFFQNLFFLFFIFCVVTDNTLLTLEGTACPHFGATPRNAFLLFDNKPIV